MKTPQNAQRSTSRFSASPRLCVKNSHSRRGATLLVTLGILTILSVMAVTFLVTSRLQRQAAASKQNRFAARNHLDEALHLAMKMVEESFTYPNYTGRDTEIPDSAFLTEQRLAPVSHWFAQDYAETNQISKNIAFQALDVLASPASSNGPTVNLLSPRALSLIPSALTNGLPLSATDNPVFRSGWLNLELMLGDSLNAQLRSSRARVAFAVFNCSGFLDANYFVSGPTTQKLPRVCFSQPDVVNWITDARANYQEDYFKPLEEVLDLNDPENLPFFHLSYDPGPDLYPLHYDCYETCTTLGRHRFDTYPVVDLNLPQAYRVLSVLKEQATYWRFNINTLTNHLILGTASTDAAAPWFNDSRFKGEWLDPVTDLTRMMAHEEPASTLHRLPGKETLAWSIANFMDEDSIPQISTFSADSEGVQQLATRVNYAVEDVPLINKVSIFNIYDDDEDLKAPKDPDYYDLPDSGLSNHYAVAVELWYPFAPNPPRDYAACYVGIYTNAEDVITTTNRPWSQNNMRDWFDWNSAGSSNSVMKTLFYSWARAYTNRVGPTIWSHPLWQTVTDQGDLWFTTGMTNHPSWPAADTNGVVSLADTAIWKAFYPDTYAVLLTNQYEQVTTNEAGTVATNLVDAVTTNVYTYVTTTNSTIEWVSEPDLSTNRFVGHIGNTAPDHYPVLLWSNLTSSAFTTNVLGAFFDSDENLTPFFTPASGLNPAATNHLQSVSGTPEGLTVVVSNGVSGTVSTNSGVTFVTSPWVDSGEWVFSAQTNILVRAEISPVEPLPMPEDLGLSLAALFFLLPTNSSSSLYDFLMLQPDDFGQLDWERLFDYFNQNPSILNNLLPSNNEPSLGNMTVEDRHVLWPEDSEEKETVILDPDVNEKLSADMFQGYFWTVYPKQTVTFKEVTQPDTQSGGTSTSGEMATTNYHALGMTLNGKRNTIWVRPAVTLINPNSEDESAQPPSDDDEDATLSDVIVDEALLTNGADGNGVPVWGWTVVTNLFIPDPRQNAYARDWRKFPEEKQWLDKGVLYTTNLNTGVSELPFIHFNKPFTSIGDIGHIYASYNRHSQGSDDVYPEGTPLFDTVTFSARSGAALLDVFTVHPTNAPTRGLVQANTQQRPVIQALLSDVAVGWTNSVEGAEGQRLLRELDTQLAKWPEVYIEALTNAPYSMGWRSFADMLPNLSTNKAIQTESVWNDSSLHPMHDYTEDALRGLIDKVSFRQNIFVIIVAAQTLSPASSESHPIVLSDQRAAVTVIRDAYTGRWTVHAWQWLTD